MARRSINDAAKVFIAVFVLGPPIGGSLVLIGLQVSQWITSAPTEPLLQRLAGLGQLLLVTVPLSYYVGGMAAGIAGLALAAYIAWGYRFTLWACVAAALIYPAGFAVQALIVASKDSLTAALIYAAVMAAGAVASAVICYFLLRRTSLVRRLNAPPQA